MKFTINVDCTPEEAREFMGLPDVKPMQDAMMKQMQDKMAENIKAMDPQEIMKQWMPNAQAGVEQFQSFFQSFMNAATQSKTKK